MARNFLPMNPKKFEQNFKNLASKFKCDEDTYSIVIELKNKLKDDFKIEFDFENLAEFKSDIGIAELKNILGIQTLNIKGKDFTFLGLAAGGDWEQPVYFIVYFENDNSPRVYIPTDGNVWNKKTKQAIGNDDDADGAYTVVYSADLIIKDISKRLSPKESKIDDEVDDEIDDDYSGYRDTKTLKNISDKVPESFAVMSIDEFRKRFREYFANKNISYSLNYLKTQLKDDFKVEFDFENIVETEADSGLEKIYSVLEIQTLNIKGKDFTFLGLAAGGDWEYPVYFIIYFDDKLSPRIYIPTEGNVWNTTTHCAIGNNEKSDIKNSKIRYKDLKFDPNWDQDDLGFDLSDRYDAQLIIQDIKERFSKSIPFDASAKPQLNSQVIDQGEGFVTIREPLPKHPPISIKTQANSNKYLIDKITELYLIVNEANFLRNKNIVLNMTASLRDVVNELTE